MSFFGSSYYNRGGLVARPGGTTYGADLLGCVVTYLSTAPPVAALLANGYGGGGYGTGGYGGEVKVYDELAPADAVTPFVVVADYDEALPGDSLEDQDVTLLLQVVSPDVDTARAVGAAVKRALDTPNINPVSQGRPPFAWAGGTETGCFRNHSRPRRRPGIGRLGRYVWVEEIEYEFRVSPQQ